MDEVFIQTIQHADQIGLAHSILSSLQQHNKTIIEFGFCDI